MRERERKSNVELENKKIDRESKERRGGGGRGKRKRGKKINSREFLYVRIFLFGEKKYTAGDWGTGDGGG